MKKAKESKTLGDEVESPQPVNKIRVLTFWWGWFALCTDNSEVLGLISLFFLIENALVLRKNKKVEGLKNFGGA